MGHINIEIKAKSKNLRKIRHILKSKKADYRGADYQIDTYFNVTLGRLKLREGNIEKLLIHYQREDQKGPKQSNVTLFRSPPDSSLKELLVKSLGILTVVDKKREIYFIDNIKFHLDIVKGLGSFVEIEAIDLDRSIGKAKLLEQCKLYMHLFDINDQDLIAVSYSDLLVNKKV